MTPGRRATGALALAAVLSVAVAAGCSLSGSSGAQSGSEARSRSGTGQVVLTGRGAMAVLKGDTASVSEAVLDMFENLDIYEVGQSSFDGGMRVRGQAGTSEVFVDLQTVSPDRVEVSVRVRETGPGSRGRWDRLAARGLLEEIRRWTAR